MIYRRGKTWWYKFKFCGRVYQESAKTRRKDVAIAAERQRRRDLEESYNGISKRAKPVSLKVAAGEYLKAKTPTLAPKSVQVEKSNLKHILPVLGSMLTTDIDHEGIADYQRVRLREGASPKTINLEVGTVRAILRKLGLWGALQPHVKMLPTFDDVGRDITADEEHQLLQACAQSRSRSLLPAVTIALATGMRYSEIRLLRWNQIDLAQRRITVGRTKTAAGTGRRIPLNERAVLTLTFWAQRFPDRKATHFVFPSEQYGLAGNAREVHAHNTDPTKAITGWKEAWQRAKRAAGVSCRFHDLRHTAVTRMVNGGVTLPVIASIFGWSPATTVRMSKRYGHVGEDVQRRAVSLLEQAPTIGNVGSANAIETSAPVRAAIN